MVLEFLGFLRYFLILVKMGRVETYSSLIFREKRVIVGMIFVFVCFRVLSFIFYKM